MQYNLIHLKVKLSKKLKIENKLKLKCIKCAMQPYAKENRATKTILNLIQQPNC